MTTRRMFLTATGLAGLPFTARSEAPGGSVTIKSDRPTVLMADAARLQGGLKARPAEHGAKRFHVSHWTSAADSFTWTVEVPQASLFEVVALVRGAGSTLELKAGGRSFEKQIDTGWDRIALASAPLQVGTNTLVLSAPSVGAGLELYSLELITAELRERLNEEARAVRSDTSWMRQAKYGLQFHWTSQSQPRKGPAKPYSDAVRDFPVKEFARIVRDTGAGYVILTTSHAEYFFPAPIRAIDRIMPGRTARRDLVHDLINALGEHGIRLMLYYHTGHDHWREPDGWWVRCGFEARNPETFLANWCAITSEVGNRYGEGLAGWFFDDSCVYYPLNPDFRRLTLAAKSGNAKRLVCYNPWIWPRCTDFQDYFCGEGYEFLKVRKNLPDDGTGIFIAGPQKGLQAHTNFTLESDWCHSQRDTPIPPPRIPRGELVSDIRNATSHGIVPSINLEIYQDVGIGDASQAYLEALRAAVKA